MMPYFASKRARAVDNQREPEVTYVMFTNLRSQTHVLFQLRDNAISL